MQSVGGNIKECKKEPSSSPTLGHPSLHRNPNPWAKEEISVKGPSRVGTVGTALWDWSPGGWPELSAQETALLSVWA